LNADTLESQVGIFLKLSILKYGSGDNFSTIYDSVLAGSFSHIASLLFGELLAGKRTERSDYAKTVFIVEYEGLCTFKRFRHADKRSSL